MCDTYIDSNQIDLTPSTKLLDDQLNEEQIKDQQKCHFVNNNLNKIYYHAHPLSNPINCSSSIQLSNCTPSLISPSSSKEGDQKDLNNLKLNQALSIPTINYFSSNTNLANGLYNSTILNSPNSQQNNQQQNGQQETKSNSPTNKIYQDSIELQTSNIQFQQQLMQPNKSQSNQFKSNLNSCSGSCNQLIHGNVQMTNGLPLNNNFYSNQNRNSFAAFSQTNGYLTYLNRFNLLRNSMRSTNELLSNTIPSSIYGQLTIASMKQHQRNSVAWSPSYWPPTVNGGALNGQNAFNTINNVKNLNFKNTNGIINSKLNNANYESNSLLVCSTPIKQGETKNSIEKKTVLQCTNCKYLNSSSLNQINRSKDELDKKENPTNSNHEKKLDSSLNFSKLNGFLNNNSRKDQSIEEDKISLYDNVDNENDCLKPLLEKSEQPISNSRSSSEHVRLIENCCRDDVQHSGLSLNNKLCL